MSGTTALIGAPLKSVPPSSASGMAAGTAYVYGQVDGIWTEQQELTEPTPGYFDEFGGAVGLSGSTAVVTAPGGGPHTSSGGVGAAYMYGLAGGVWSEEQALGPDQETTAEGFGQSATLSGTTTVIGAPGATVDGAEDAGAAYVFRLEGGVWKQVAKLLDPSPAAEDLFGLRVALSGSTLVVATVRATGPGVGVVYVYRRTGGRWSQTPAQTIAIDAGAVSLSGSTMLLGSAYTGNPAYVYVWTGSEWDQQAQLFPTDDPVGFGDYVALQGSTAAVEGQASYTSSHDPVYVFRRTGSTWEQTHEFIRIGQYDLATNGSDVLVGAFARNHQAGGVFAYAHTR